MTEHLHSAKAAALAEIERINAELAKHKAAAKSTAIAQVKAMMADHGLTISDIGRLATVASAKTAKASASQMYRNADGQTWAGKGKRPNWLRAELMRGKTLAEFKIAA